MLKKIQQKHTSNTYFSTSFLIMWFAFNKYYTLTNKTPVYIVVLLLNPIL